MKKALSVLVIACLLLCGIAAQAETVDYSPWLWFIQGGSAPEAKGSGVVMWYIGEHRSSFRQDLVPEARQPKNADDVGYVIVAQQGSSSLAGFYSNGATGNIPTVDVIVYNADTGSELNRENVRGGDPPERTTSTAMAIYGPWPDDEAIKAAVEELCDALPEKKEAVSPWQYTVRTEDDRRTVLNEYSNTDPETLEYLVFEPGIEIQGYTGYEGGALQIPEELDGLPVTAIGRAAFRQKNSFSAIIVPDTVTRIGEEAFSGCWDAHIVLPDSLTMLPYMAMNSVINTEIKLPSGLKAIGEYGLSSNFIRQEMELPEGLERIDAMAFHGYEQLESLTLPRSLKSLDFSSFHECEQLVLQVYRDSYAHHFLEDGGWEDALYAYAERLGSSPDDLDWCHKPAYEVID